jgi:hypothetical protein
MEIDTMLLAFEASFHTHWAALELEVRSGQKHGPDPEHQVRFMSEPGPTCSRTGPRPVYSCMYVTYLERAGNADPLWENVLDWRLTRHARHVLDAR